MVKARANSSGWAVAGNRVHRDGASLAAAPLVKSQAPAFLSTFFDAAIASVAPVVAAGRFKPFSGDVELDPGTRTVALPGHSGYLVDSESKQLLVWGDIVHVAAIQLQNPEATVE